VLEERMWIFEFFCLLEECVWSFLQDLKSFTGRMWFFCEKKLEFSVSFCNFYFWNFFAIFDLHMRNDIDSFYFWKTFFLHDFTYGKRFL
jgi:hypothetical protein